MVITSKARGRIGFNKKGFHHRGTEITEINVNLLSLVVIIFRSLCDLCVSVMNFFKRFPFGPTAFEMTERSTDSVHLPKPLSLWQQAAFQNAKWVQRSPAFLPILLSDLAAADSLSDLGPHIASQCPNYHPSHTPRQPF